MSCEPPAEPTREEVLAWMRENGKGYQRAAWHFKLPVQRVKSWAKRDKKAAPLVLLDDERNARARADAPTAPPPAPTDAASAEPLPDRPLAEQLDEAIAQRLSYLLKPESMREKAQQAAALTIAILLDKRTAIEDLDKRRSAQPASAIPGSPEWEAELRESLRSIPRRLIG